MTFLVVYLFQFFNFYIDKKEVDIEKLLKLLPSWNKKDFSVWLFLGEAFWPLSSLTTSEK